MTRLEVAARVGRRLAGQDGVTGAFLAGSVSAGLATPMSDVDVYLVGPDLAPDRTQLIHDGVRLDVHRLPHGALGPAVAAATAPLPSVGDGDPGPAEADLSTATRLATMTVLRYDPELRGVRFALTEHRLGLRRQLVRFFLARAESQDQDVRGFVAAGDLDSAALTARSAVLSTAKAITVACGDVYFGEKWVLAQLRRSAPGSFPHGHVVDAVCGRLHHTDGTELVAELDTLARSLAAIAAVAVWFDLPVDGWPDWGWSGRGYVRSPDSAPRSFEDGLVVTRPHAAPQRLSWDAALIWALCSGVSRPELAARRSRVAHLTERVEEMDEARLAAVLDQLLAADLLHEAGRDR